MRLAMIASMEPDPATESFDAWTIGVVSSTLAKRENAPRQPDEGAPPAELVIDPRYADALEGIAVGDPLIVITWLDKGDRATLRVHPRGDLSRPPQGVFATRSPDRPNPIGLHVVEVTSVEGTTIGVAGIEAIDGTPILDLKPVLNSEVGTR